MDLQIRLADLTHLQELVSIYTAANQYKLARDDRSWDPGFSQNGVKWMIGLGTTYVSLLDGVVVGCFALEWEDKEGCDQLETGQAGYIKRIAVHQDFHGQHVGEQLLDWAARQIADKGLNYLRLDCNVANIKLCTYYEKRGFQLVTTKPFPDYHYTAALYERPIKN